MTSDPQALRATVEASRGPLDDETLGRVICAIMGVEFSRAPAWGSDKQIAVYGQHDSTPVWHGPRHLAPDVSIDAAVGLVERGRPGWRWVVDSDGMAALWSTDETGYAAGEEPCTSPALALIAALLRAKEAEHDA
ncbi:hypothetical protein [Chelatococcus reniformis]|uniref:Uncharacterized protein n=1 Tax=Chelatococcus reniformis TaxID=1494448 RepID=A0A916XPY0_9HYPH|nr:hypothetical protein [Chelatococcus reniformis]GGC90755.1 hypothetical protein GCM10010994_55700 [Chelatococcus reniformis]